VYVRFTKIYETDETSETLFCDNKLIVNQLRFWVKQNETTYKSVKLAVNYRYLFDCQHFA